MKRTLRGLTVVAPWLIALGCGGGGGNHAVLTRVVPATSCAAGGVTIGSGTDGNDNGVLDDAEVTQTNDVCNGAMSTGMTGASGFDTLVVTTDLAAGDPNCSNGGTKIEIGLDNGMGDGTENDGVLQPGEVNSTKYVCNGGSPDNSQPLDPPSGPAARFKVDTSGGDGPLYGGGSGGDVYAYTNNGTGGGHIKVFQTGAADASFTVPSYQFRAGATPLVVSADLTLNRYADAAAGLASADTYFAVNGNTTLYKNVGGVATAVTSIDVQAGKTLTFPLNWGPGSYAYVSLEDDVRNAGTIKTAYLTDGKSRARLTMYCQTFHGLEGSSIDLSGAVAPGGASPGDTAGDGGRLYLYAYGNLVNRGTINTSGGNGDYPGDAGRIDLYASDGALHNAGSITANGGNTTASYGGGGRYIRLSAGYRGVFSSGPISNNGGSGFDGGGSGGGIELYPEFGPALVSATLSSKGGTCAGIDCYGGDGGSVEVYAYSGRLVIAGDIDTSGADGKGTGSGGYGGSITIGSYESSNWPGSSLTPPTGSIHVGANLLTRGGTGGSGGGGGSIDIQLDPYQSPHGQEIVLFGYSSIKASGGNSTSDYGSDGGDVYFYHNNYATYGYNLNFYGPSGAVVVDVPIDAHGGDGQSGGSGGEVDLYTQTNYSFGKTYEKVFLHASIDVHGGSSSDSSSSAGDGGGIYLDGVSGVENTATHNANGGQASGPFGYGGQGGWVQLGSSSGQCVNPVTLDVNGGSATGAQSYGGRGGSVQLFCQPATNTGALNAKGGNGTLEGGDGGEISLFTSGAMSSSNTGTLAIAGGTGATNGQKGTVRIDGVDVTP